MFNKKGQAAMEFLMTYGWAILAAVIVVGVLWYMIGNPANLAGNNFQMSAPFVANALAISATELNLEIRNGNSDSITATGVDAGSACTWAGSQIVGSGQVMPFNLTCSGLTSKDKFAEDVTLTYTKSGSTLIQTAKGSVNAQVP